MFLYFYPFLFFLFPQMVEIRRTDLIHSVLETGLNTGCFQCELMGTNSDKTKKLSLGSKTSLRNESGLHVIIEDRTDPIWSAYALLHRLITQHLPADYKLQIFLKKAPKAEISRRQALGDFSEAWWNANINHSHKAMGKIGKNQPTQMFRIMAARAKFADPTNFMARSVRRTGITKAARSGMDPLILAQKSRHQSIKTNMLCQDPNSESFALANTALHHGGEDSKPAAAVTAAPSNIVIPP
jgi:hypothetical protein